MVKAGGKANRYKALIERIFRNRYRKGAAQIKFERDELIAMALDMGIDVPKNLGDVIYSLRYRRDAKASFARSPMVIEWIIERNWAM